MVYVGIIVEFEVTLTKLYREFDMVDNVQIHRWSENWSPSKLKLIQRLKSEGLDSYQWSNSPDDVYSAHSHTYDKVIYVLQGSITFGLPDSGEYITLNEGDRLDLPAGVIHDAVVGPQGVICLEAHNL